MSAQGETAAQKAPEQTTTTTTSEDLLQSAIAATEARGIEKPRAKQLLDAFVEEATKGTLSFDRNVSHSVSEAIRALDEKISEQLAAVMHHEKFRQLEGSWRGLLYMVKNGWLGSDTKIYARILNIRRGELLKDLEKASSPEESLIADKLYKSEFGTAGGSPYGILVGDYEFENSHKDLTLLRLISGVASAAFCPFLSAASPALFGFDDWTELPHPKDLKAIFETKPYVKWRGFRESEDSRFVTLAMPRVLARLPHGSQTDPIDEFAFEEVPTDPGSGVPLKVGSEQYTWMNAAYVLATRLMEAFAETGFCTRIRGRNSGGQVPNLPVHTFKTASGDLDINCPTEVSIDDRREKEISDSGFMPLVHYKNTDFSVFFGAQTTQKPKKYDKDNATANAAICARLPYVMAASRFAHHLKVMGRDMVGRFVEGDDIEKELRAWISQFVLEDENPSEDQRARYPLKKAEVTVIPDSRNPGSYRMNMHLVPWLQLEELTASVRMVARLPKKS